VGGEAGLMATVVGATVAADLVVVEVREGKGGRGGRTPRGGRGGGMQGCCGGAQARWCLHLQVQGGCALHQEHGLERVCVRREACFRSGS
jgi:hypothetical protein